MSFFKQILVMVCFLSMTSNCHGENNNNPDLLFVGDINLGRLVQKEIAATGQSPWYFVSSTISKGNIQVGNFEGVVGTDDNACLKPHDYCFHFKPDALNFLSDIGFTHLGLANNHSFDQGEEGLRNTHQLLSNIGLNGLGLAESPYFVSSNGMRYGLVFINRIAGANGNQDNIPSHRISQALDLAKAGADWVIVYIHWGHELATWADQSQRDDAKWLINHGADMIVGSHPHVIQPVDCVDGHPVWFSLGNHIFDQKYESTHTGGIITCRGESSLECTGYNSIVQEGSSFLKEINRNIDLDTPKSCIPTKHGAQSFMIDDYSISLGDSEKSVGTPTTSIHISKGNTSYALHDLPLRRVSEFKSRDGQEMLFVLVEVYSDLDQKIGVRPHVYHVGDNGINPLWRGSGLAFPLIDALPMKVGNHDMLCALHSKGSFLTGVEINQAPFVMIYDWNGFGFSAAHDRKALANCEAVFGDSKIQ